MEPQALGLLGGTFDPIHCGHLQIAQACLAELPLQQIHFIPCQQPVHKIAPLASAQQRFEMLQIATAPYPNFYVNRCEIDRKSASYTIDTLSDLRHIMPNTRLCWILGSDALLDFMQWRQWRSILHLAHLIVIIRPKFNLPTQGALAELVQNQRLESPELLAQHPAGGIFMLRLAPLAIASRELRKQIHAGHAPVNQLPKGVWEYIQSNQLYL